MAFEAKRYQVRVVSWGGINYHIDLMVSGEGFGYTLAHLEGIYSDPELDDKDRERILKLIKDKRVEVGE